MTVTKDDFEKVWASQSPLTPYSFSDAQYKEGWNFVGATPPSRQMWDAFMQNADEKLKYLYQHEDIPLGHEYFTFNPSIPQGSLPLFGGEYSRETYSDLWAWVQTQTGYLKTEAEWQTLSASNNGNVPYYSDGDGSTTFRVPSLKCWVRGANGTVSEVGSYLAAGLPNITGAFHVGGRYETNPNTMANNAFFGSDYGASWYAGGNARDANNSMNFDASRSSSVYGNANTVVPESIVGMWLVKAYGVIVDTGQIDEQQYIDDRLATKLNITGGNLIGNLTINSKIVPTITPINQTNRINMTTSYQAVYSLTIPSNSVYCLEFYLEYQQSKPNGAIIASGGNNVDYAIAKMENQSQYNSCVSHCGYFADDTTLYFLARYSSDGSNTWYVRGAIFNLG